MTQTLNQAPPDLAAVGRRLVYALFSAQAMYSGASVATFALTGLILESMTGDARLVGLPSTVMIIGRAIAAYPLGWLMDKMGRRAGLSIGYLTGLGASVLALVAVLQNNPALFVLSSFIGGASRAASEQSRYVAAEVSPPSERASSIGTVVFAGTIGSIGGPLLIAPSSEAGRALGVSVYAGPWVIAIFFSLLSAVVLYLFLRPEPLTIARQLAGPAAALEEQPSLSTIFSRPIIWVAIAGLLVGQVVMTMIMVINPVHMIHVGHGVAEVAWVTMAHTIGMFGPSAFMGRVIDKLGAIPSLALGGCLLIASAVVAPLSPELFPLIGSLFLLGLSWNVTFIAGSTLFASGLGTSKRGRAQGVSETVVAVASGSGSALSGVLYAGGGLITVSVIGGAAAVILLLVVAWYTFSNRPPQVAAS